MLMAAMAATTKSIDDVDHIDTAGNEKCSCNNTNQLHFL